MRTCEELTPRLALGNRSNSILINGASPRSSALTSRATFGEAVLPMGNRTDTCVVYRREKGANEWRRGGKLGGPPLVSS